MARRVTLATVAEALGVSAMTVSNAYNRPEKLSPELRERVFAVAEELGYPGPHATARSLRRGRTSALGVVLGETVKSAKSVIEAFQGVNVNIMVQQFIKEADATDIRALVIGERVVAAMKRSGPPGEFRSNLHRGGSGEAVRITPQERSAAVRAARTLGLNVCGVDMLRSKAGPLVVELNSSPGIEGLEKATGVDVATAMIEFLERNAAPGHTRTKGKG